MKKIFKRILVLLPVALVFGFAYYWYANDRDTAVPDEDALAALAANPALSIQFDDWLLIQPAGSTPDIGVILYPGAYCDIRGYAPVLTEIAAAGYKVVGVKMPFNFSIFGPNKADDVIAAFPDIKRWIIVGHSMGGAMAGRYAFLNEDKLDGVIFWDSYPPESNSLADSKLPLTHIHRARLNGEMPNKFQVMQHVYPKDAVWVPIPGGIHMYFGSFVGGPYEEEWEPEISREAQHEIVVAATLEALKRMTGDEAS
ncbi:MAG: alpha/beta hydrolase [Gammaproteobacteria bacterium]